MTRKVILTPEAEGGFSVSCPSLPGCYSQGETKEEALANIAEAIQLWIEIALEDGETIPKDEFIIETVNV